MVSSKRLGRKTRLTPELIERICEYISKGNYVSTACKAVGIGESTYYDWLKQAEEGDTGIFGEFARATKQAEAESEARLVEVVLEAAEEKKEWLPAITFLERRFRERWSRPAPVQIQQGDTKVLNITHVEVILDEPKLIEGEARSF